MIIIEFPHLKSFAIDSTKKKKMVKTSPAKVRNSQNLCHPTCLASTLNFFSIFFWCVFSWFCFLAARSGFRQQMDRTKRLSPSQMVVLYLPYSHCYDRRRRPQPALCHGLLGMVHIFISIWLCIKLAQHKYPTRSQLTTYSYTNIHIYLYIFRGPGIMVLLISWCMTLNTMWQMIQLHECVPGTRFDRYVDLGRHAFGQKLGPWIVLPQQLIVQVGCDIVYMVTGGKCLKKFIEMACVNCTPIKQSYWILIFGGLQFFLSQLPNFNSVAGVSLAAAVMSLRLLFWFFLFLSMLPNKKNDKLRIWS